MTGVHRERLYLSSWDRSFRDGLLKENDKEEEMMGTPSAFQLRMNSLPFSIFTC
uniref:Uncharacterized protein n=1 Tax=Anguilla anguilla TaxID=7936 RepID=A0A0E9QAN6_ANGAN